MWKTNNNGIILFLLFPFPHALLLLLVSSNCKGHLPISRPALPTHTISCFGLLGTPAPNKIYVLPGDLTALPPKHLSGQPFVHEADPSHPP